MGKEWCYQARCSYGAEVIDMKVEEIDKLQKAENTAMRIILRAPKWAHKQQ